MDIYYAETGAFSCEIVICREGIAVDSVTADGDSLDAKDEALSRAGYERQECWVLRSQLPVSRYLAAICATAASRAGRS